MHTFITIKGVIQIWLVYVCASKKLHLLLSPQMDKFILWGCLEVIKSTSGRIHYKVHKWTSSSHKDALKLLSPQVDEFIIKSINGRVHYLVHKWMSSSHNDALKLLSPQMNEFII